jgi:hypothetical protein
MAALSSENGSWRARGGGYMQKSGSKLKQTWAIEILKIEILTV